MDKPLCGPTAFRYYRIPPQILALYPPVIGQLQDTNHLKLMANETIQDLLGMPLHRLVTNNNERRATKLYRSHLLSGELPFGCFRETEHGFTVTSPAFTLFTMAPLVSRLHLLMAAYELCGSFAVFKPSPRTERMLQQALDQGFISPRDGWQRVRDTKGNPTSLWKRDPLITPHELLEFAQSVAGMHGAKKLRWAAERVLGVCASPFEVQAAILQGLSRRLGGEGLPITINQRIPLSSKAQRIYPHVYCLADLYIEETDAHPALDIECQGRSVHSSEAAGLSDSDRIAALESMGVQVLPLTYAQFADPTRYQAIRELIAAKLNTRFKLKTSAEQKAETALRSQIFIDWTTLGT